MDEIKKNEQGALSLAEAAAIYSEEPNDTNFLMVLAILKRSEIWIPMLETDAGPAPYILESEDGLQFLPVFSDVNQIPDEYAESLLWASFTFDVPARYIMESTQVSDILMDAFTNSVLISEESVRVMMDENAAEHAVDSSELKLFPAEEDGEAAELKRKAYAFFYNRKDVNKAYFAKLLNGSEMSYVFVVDVFGNSQDMFKALFEEIGSEDVSMPIDYTVYPSLKEQLEEIGCQPFFIA